MADSKKYNGSTWEHSLRKLTTATDTLTTLPADVYADGTNATVGLKGNMQQTGTPTPQAPIQPSECGDLETSGAHSGQYKIPISSAGQTTNVYLGEEQTVRQIKKLVLTGEENWKSLSYGSAYLDTITDYSRVEGNISKCSHFLTNNSVKTADDAGNGITFYNAATAYYRMYLKDITTFTTIDSLKSYLQQQYANGTPVTVWYVLSSATTGIVNEPIRKIGDYADTVSGITIPTTTGKDTFDVQTTLKPSEIELTYTGWHDATVKEWDGSDWE